MLTFTENRLLKVFLVPRTTAHGQSPCLGCFAQKTVKSIVGFPTHSPRLCPANDPVVCICAAVVLLRRCRCLRCWSLSCWSLSGRSLCGWSLGCWSRSCRCRGCYLRLILVLAAQGEVESQETTGRADGLRLRIELFLVPAHRGFCAQRLAAAAPGLGRRSAAASLPALRLQSEPAWKESFKRFLSTFVSELVVATSLFCRT